MTLLTVMHSHVLADDVIGGIVAKEQARQYPLDAVNDMRALINFATHFRKGCLSVADELHSIARNPLRISGCRLLRVVSALFLGIGVAARLEQDTEPGLKPLIRDLGAELCLRASRYPRSDYIDLPLTASPWTAKDACWREVLQISALASELSDRLGMGEQSLYAQAPAMTNEGERRIVQTYFQQRSSRDFPHVLDVVTYLNGDVETFAVPMFRGRPFGDERTRFRAGVAVRLDGAEIIRAHQIRSLRDQMSSAFSAIVGREERIADEPTREVIKMTIYSSEVRELLNPTSKGEFDAGIVQSVVSAANTQQLGLYRPGGYALHMFRLIREGLEHWSDDG